MTVFEADPAILVELHRSEQIDPQRWAELLREREDLRECVEALCENEGRP